jgi:hypothetical protein
MKTIGQLVILAIVYNLFPFGQVMAQQSVQDKDPKHTEEIKRVVSRNGPSIEKVVTVKLKDKTVITGSISEIADDHFVVKGISGAPYSIAYAQVEKLNVHKLDRRGFTTGPSVYKKVIAGLAIGVSIFVIACLATPSCREER